MASRLNALEIFREASLRSGLLTLEQWQEAAGRVEIEGNGRASQIDWQAVSDQVADELIRRRRMTEYQSQQLRAGRTKLNLGPYRITHWLGQGGMGQVFAGVHEIMGRRVAIKVLPLEKATDESRQNFIREIRLQAKLDCPYLVRAFDAGRDGNVHYLVTELVEGTDLRRLVRTEGRLSMQQSASIIAQAAAGLAYAHGSGLIHRDVKPANILVTHDGRAKVSDVGLAAWARGFGHRLEADHADDADETREATEDPRAGKIVGTADFLSPEQIRTPDQIGPASDIYALGCSLYYACTGKVPFPGGDTRDKCRRHLTETPWHPRKFAPELSDEFVDMIADMMEKDPARRVASAVEVVERLTPWAAAVSADDELIMPPTHQTTRAVVAGLSVADSEPLPPADLPPNPQAWLQQSGLPAVAEESRDDPTAAASTKSGSTDRVTGPGGQDSAGPADETISGGPATRAGSAAGESSRFTEVDAHVVLGEEASPSSAVLSGIGTGQLPPPPPGPAEQIESTPTANQAATAETGFPARQLAREVPVPPPLATPVPAADSDRGRGRTIRLVALAFFVGLVVGAICGIAAGRGLPF